MVRKKKILIVSPNINLLCGRSRTVINNIISLQNRGYDVILATNGGDNLSILKEKNIKHLLLKNFSEGVRPFKLINSIFELREIVNIYSFEVVHTHHRFFELSTFFVKYFSFGRKFKSVFTAHNVYLNHRILQFKSDIIIAVSYFIKRHLEQDHRVSKSKIVVLYNYLMDYEFQQIKKEYISSAHDGLLLLASGRFVPEKNFELVLETMKMFREDKNVKLLLIGQGVLSSKFSLFIRDNSLNVEIINPLKDYKLLLKTADICINTSIHEGFSYFILDCISLNKLILTSNKGGHSELLKRYKKVFYYNANYKKDLFNEIMEIKLNININKNDLLENDNELKTFSESNNIGTLIKIYD